ncbi:small multi-drug export protein [Desulforamulus aquiferis]|uniref:Small multi-drug export protein n=1 Tax=Desulforamulus aquiferis TaxID=1397668 RepID=A0AAW7Z8W2_9FIRM|nr:small multi-drug export protein [Desulforamulus aquiferis]MDO7785913.1 small multi-drug export protein [Desulforamulus aquiferis]
MNFFELLWAYMLVFLLAAVPFFEAYVVIPLAIITGLSVVPTFIIGLAGNAFTVFLLIIFIHKIKVWRQNRRASEQKEPSKRSQRAQKLWEKYGLPGLAILGPLLVGSHLTAFMGVSLGENKQRTLYWMVISITLWSIVFSILAYLGVDFLGYKDHNFLNRFFPQ